MKQGDKIVSELKNMGSTLGNIPKRMPYEIPENYFQEFQQKLNDELTDQNAVINSFSKEMPYESPQGYFENFPKNIINTIQKENRPQTTVIHFWTKFRLAAAAVLLIACGIAGFKYLQYQNSIEHKFAKIPATEIKEYAQQKMLDIPNVENIANTSKQLPNELTKDEIKEYLNETGWE